MSIILAFSFARDTIRLPLFLMNNHRRTAKLSETTGTTDAEISEVLLNAEYKGVLVAAWDPTIIRKFRSRFMDAIHDCGTDERTCLHELGDEIARQLCEEERSRISQKDQEFIRWLDIPDKRLLKEADYGA